MYIVNFIKNARYVLNRSYFSALKWLRGSDDIQTELLQLQTETESEKEEGSISLMEILKTAEFRKPLIIACVIMIAQQFSGINAVDKK